MTLVIGMDEAGYGPNLGPLAIGLSAWEVGGQRPEIRDAQAEIDLYQLLEPLVCDAPDGDRIAIADSKALYKPGGGLGQLERGLLSMLAACSDAVPRCLDTLIDALDADAEDRRKHLPWHQNGFDPDVPADCAPSEINSAIDRVNKTRDQVRICSLRGRLVYPQEFNAICNKYGSKGLALSHWTLSLLQETLNRLSPVPSPQSRAPIFVTCDKHGGRNNYAGLLAEYFPESHLRVIVESRPRSAYLLQSEQSQIRIEFRTKGESRLEAALASMVAKYLRELSMQAFNSYWRSHLPDLKPTAGYPVDAKRFKADIESKQRELGIADDTLWRSR